MFPVALKETGDLREIREVGLATLWFYNFLPGPYLLQAVQNAAARVVTLTPKHVHITPILINLHWLPVEFRITFKVLLLVYKALHGLAPSYISDLLNFKTYSRSLRSSCKEYLVVPRSRLKTYGDRAFSIAGPKLWNDLPLEIRKCASVATFKQSLKTFLFKLAYRL